MLDTHPRIYCGTELRVVQALANLWSVARQSGQPLLSDAYLVDMPYLRRVFADLVLAFLEPGWRVSGKARVAEKTPSNLLAFPELRTLFPESPLIHVIRDGRDVVASRLERDKASAVESHVDTVALAARRAQEWVEAMAIRKQIVSDPELSRGYFEVRYEALVRTPHTVLEKLFAFLGETFDAAVLSYHEVPRNVSGTEEWSAEAVRRPIFESSIGRWHRTLGAPEQAAVLAVARDTLSELGYLDEEQPV
jgi:hypothetical protein